MSKCSENGRERRSLDWTCRTKDLTLVFGPTKGWNGPALETRCGGSNDICNNQSRRKRTSSSKLFERSIVASVAGSKTR